MGRFEYRISVKALSIMILLALSFSLIPLTNVTPPADTSPPVIFTLDVCAAQSAGINAAADIPFVHECLCKFLELNAGGLALPSDYSFKPFLFASQAEHPPEFRPV